jgi:hypothetical protein
MASRNVSILRVLLAAGLLLSLAACGRDRQPAESAQHPAQQLAPPAANMQLLRAELQRVLSERGIELDSAGQPLRAISSIPKRSYIVPPRFNDIPSGSAELEWLHYQTGDYDHNGEVNISDLTPVGTHFGKNTGSPDWLTGALLADGDGNGEINIADVTPIGQNFGAVVGGYVVQARSLPSFEYSDYGFVSFSSGFDIGNAVVFNYTAPGNADFDSFRISPVAPTREFDWQVYRMNFPTSMATHPTLTSYKDKPILAFVDWDNTALMYARALVSRPGSPADWDTHAIDTDGVIADQPGLAVIFGLPAIAYNGLDITQSNQIRYARALVAEPTGAADWQTHVIAPGPIQPLSLIEKQLRPVISTRNGAGQLSLAVSSQPQPTGFGDWASIPVNSGSTLTEPDICLVNDRVVLSSYDYTNPGVFFSTAKVVIPSGASDFDNFPLHPIGNTSVRSSVATIGGLPHVCAPNEAMGSLDYLRSGDKFPNTAAVWFLHSVFSDATDILAPELTMLDGKPLVAFGRFDLNLAWSRIEQADAASDWLVSEELQGTLNFGVGSIGLTVTDNLPIIAFVHYDAEKSERDITIAVAVER